MPRRKIGTGLRLLRPVCGQESFCVVCAPDRGSRDRILSRSVHRLLTIKATKADRGVGPSDANGIGRVVRLATTERLCAASVSRTVLMLRGDWRNLGRKDERRRSPSHPLPAFSPSVQSPEANGPEREVFISLHPTGQGW